MISWGVENIMFVMTTVKGVKIDEATLTRPYLFFLTPLVACVWAYIDMVIIIIGVNWFVDFIHNHKPGNSKTDLESFRRAKQAALVSVPDNAPDYINSVRLQKIDLKQLRQQHHTSRDHMDFLARNSYLHVFFVPLGLATFGGGLFISQTKASTQYHSLSLIPKSDVSITGMDQMVTLAGGLMVLAAACWRAYRTHRGGLKVRKVERRRSI
jgi:hypothetical protein